MVEMSTATLELPMADEKPKAMSIKLPMDVIESARIVSAYTGETMADLLANILRPILAEMEREQIARRTQAQAPKRKGTGK
jgi:hypothetical protein